MTTPASCAASRPRRVRVLCLLALAGALVLASCSGSPTGDGPRTQSTAAGALLTGRWPLTGEPAKGAAPKHPVMVVKIDNSTSSSPQVGLGAADLVAEELVEGGLTRLAVFYYSRTPGTVGPVRSFRATDIGIVQPADAVLVASGGAPPTVRRMREAGVRTFTEGAPGYYRDASRPELYNLFMNLPKLARTLKSPAPPDSYFPWGNAENFPKGKPARKLAVRFSPSHTTSWEFRGGKYVNLNSYARAGGQYRPDTVLVLRVRIGDAGYRDPSGARVPETKLTGKGEALVFHGGKVVRGTWSKRGLDAPVDLTTKRGDLPLPPGRVWMELVPANGGSVNITR